VFAEVFASKDVFTGIYSPKKRLVEFSIKKKNVPGALLAITKVISELKINILSGYVTAYPDEPISMVSFVADLTGLNLSVDEVVKKIQALDVVLDVKYAQPEIEGFMIDCMHFPLLALGEKSILFRLETIKNMFERIYASFGTGSAIIFYEMGIGAGERKARKLISEYELKGLDLLKIVMVERIAKGWGIPEIVHFDDKKCSAIIRVYELFECNIVKDMFNEPTSQFFKGYLKGLLKVIFSKEVEVIETSCVAKGDKYCEFHTK
jgi:predicted hydrocarbon binding protein